MKSALRLLGILVLLALVASLLPAAPLSATAPAGTVLVRLAAPAWAAARAEGFNPSYAVDYGPFAWLELEAADLARLQASGLAYELYAEPYVLDLGGRSFDPLRDGDAVPAGWQAAGGDGPDLHLVQLRSPARAGWLAELEESGLQIVQYIYPFTYVVWGEPASLERAAGAEFVRWTGDFAPAYRVLPRWRALSGEAVRADVLLYRGADVEAALAQIQALGAERQGYALLDGTFAIATFTLPGTMLQAAARVPGVYSIQPQPTDGGLRGEMSNQVNANNVDGSNAAFPGYLTWLASVGVDGSGVTMANVDGGVQDTHPDLVNRIVSCSGTTCGGGASSSHGTHTAGIMAADGSSGVVDSYGFLRGLGMAPGANLVEQVYSPYYTYPGGMLALMTDSYNNGASLSGNSWGPSGTPQGYDDDTRQVDVGVRDADPNTAGNQPLSYILSFMNGNGGYQTQGTPDEAKNIFTIGSTKMQTSGGAQILQIDDLSSNTAHGPALDGRTIPHMVAPGCSVDSTVPTNSYGLMCGTSMASPHVSGAVALFIEYYRTLTGSDPSPALVKAAYLPVAHDLAGHLDADGGILGHPFDAKQGWGRMDTEAVVDPQVAVAYYDDPLVLDNTGEVWAATLQAADPAEPVRLMLVWTDAPGHGLGGSTPAWNNDLDLVVTVGGDSYLGNNFGADGWSQTGGSADYRNNTEGVLLPAGTTGSLNIQVVASNINSDGIPNQGDATDQDFALVCYNCMSQADFTLAVTPDQFEVCAPETVSGTVQLGEVLDFTETVSLSVSSPPAGVQVHLVPAAAVPPASPELGLEVSGAATGGDYTLVLSGTAAGGLVHTTTLALRVCVGTPEAPAPLAPADGALGLLPEAVTFGWQEVPLASGYSLQVDVDPSFDNPIVALSGLPSNSYLLTDTLQADHCYFWQASAENGCGPGAWSLARFGTARRGAMLWDDVEAGGGNWTASGLWHVTTNPTDSCAKAHSGSSSWYYGLETGCDYDAGTNSGSLTLNSPVDLTGAGTPILLRFWSWEQTENYPGVDRRRVYLSANGTDWTQVWNSNNNDSAWYQVVLDASTYAGGPLYVRFEFDSRDAYSNGYRGWYVDDVELLATLPPLAGPAVAGVVPNHGPMGVATPITIQGLNLTPSPVVLLGADLLLEATFVDSQTLTAIVPASLITGTYDLTVINSDCQEDTLAGAFTVGPAQPTQLYYLPLIFK